MWSQGEAGVIAALATELSKDPGLRIGIGSRVFPAERLRDLTRATSVATLPVSEDFETRKAMIESPALQSKLLGLDMIVESEDGVIGVELKLARVPGRLAASSVGRDLESYQDALREASESLGKRFSGLIFVTNLDLPSFISDILARREIVLVPVRQNSDSLASVARIIEKRLAGEPVGSTTPPALPR